MSKNVLAGTSAPHAPERGHGSAIPERILERIRGLGHRTVTMWPYPDPCNHSPGELARIVSDYCVAYRGCTYPQLGGGPYGASRTTDRYAEACHDAFRHTSVWRFHRSGRFKEYAALREDLVDVDGLSGAPPTSPLPPDGGRSRYLEPIWLLYGMSEVFAFASGLAASAGSRYAVSVAFSGMGGRALDIRTPRRIAFQDEHRSREDHIELEPAAVDPILGVALHGRIALEKTLEVLGRFGWGGDRQRKILEYDQEMFFAKARWEYLEGCGGEWDKPA